LIAGSYFTLDREFLGELAHVKQQLYFGENSMIKQQVQKDEIMLVGIHVRTSNKSEMNPSEAKISQTVKRYFSENIASQIISRKNPGVNFCAYTEYESDCTGKYTFFIGEEVSDISDIPEDFKCITVPKGNYIKFTSPSGEMPNVVIELWQKIWQLNPEELGGKRRYAVDFEIYDKRAADPKNTVIDVFIGV